MVSSSAKTSFMCIAIYEIIYLYEIKWIEYNHMRNKIVNILNVTETEPTSLIRDFTAFIRYLRTHQIVLTRVNEFIPGKDLYELNKEMTLPLPDTTPRTDQTLYPLLHLFYHLALAGKLSQKVPEKSRINSYAASYS